MDSVVDNIEEEKNLEDVTITTEPEAGAEEGLIVVEPVESEGVKETCQTGPEKAPPHSPSSSSKKDSSAMGDPTIPCDEPTADDDDCAEACGTSPVGISEGTTVSHTKEGNIERVPAKKEKHLSWSELMELEDEENEREIQKPFRTHHIPKPIPIKTKPIIKPLMSIDQEPFEESSTEEDDEDEDQDNENRGKGPTRPTKIVLRMLPPMLTNEEFIQSVSPLPEYDYLQVLNPDPEWGPLGRSVAHVNFVDPDDAIWFVERFSGYQFFDENGEGYFATGDFALSQKVFRPNPGKENTNRGKLYETEEWQEFLEKYHEDAFQYVITTNKDILTAEQMIFEIENKPKREGPLPTPLTEFILSKTQKRREKDQKREKERADRQAKREKDREADRRMKKERKREKREKERKDRREREKLEREAKAKGATVTVSKTGQVTRWSANSSRLVQGPKEEEKAKAPEKEEPHEKRKNEQPAQKQDRGKKPVINPFSKEGKGIGPVREEKKFGKPFPTREEKKPLPPARENRKYSGSSNTADANKRGKDPGPSSSTEKEKQSCTETVKPKDTSAGGNGNGPSATGEPKKKTIVKKIIRVKKKGEGGEETVTEKVISRKVISSSSGQKGGPSTSAPAAKEKVFRENVPKEGKNTEHASIKEKPQSAPVPKEKTVTEGKSGNGAEADKRRRVRPEREIYRPGSLRKDGGGPGPSATRRNGNNGNGRGGPSEKDKVKEINEKKKEES